jgi:hypothetical protein
LYGAGAESANVLMGNAARFSIPSLGSFLYNKRLVHAPIHALRKRGTMTSSVWTRLYYYWLRIACFVCTMYFTFAFPVWPFALMGWLVLAVFFWQDFLPSTWPSTWPWG